jgi:Flp pilus assembly protein TadG
MTPPSRALVRLTARLRLLRRDTRGLALIEFAFIFPIVLLMSLGGAELCNYTVTRMRVSQLALHIADNASRIGAGGQLQVKKIYESDINDLFKGSDLQSGGLALKTNGRVILSSLEPMATPNTSKKFKIRWQRCFGSKSYPTFKYGKAGDQNLPGMGEPGRLATTTDDGQTMFVELYYRYTPLIDVSGWVEMAPRDIVEHASMLVRDTRDTTSGPDGINPVAGVIPAKCK